MVDAYASMRRDHSHAAWERWQQAAVAYHLSRNPADRPFVRPASDHVPTVSEIGARADALNRLHRKMTDVDAQAVDRAEYSVRTAWFQELIAGLYDPVYRSREAMRGGDTASAETLVRFLEADVYCFRSGYVTADVLDTMKRPVLDEGVNDRLRAVVLAAIDGNDRREFRAFIRLARSVDSEPLRSAIEARLESPMPRVQRHARWMLAGLRP